jgi:subtilisin family serine protease
MKSRIVPASGVLLAVSLLTSAAAMPPASGWEFLSTTDIRAEDFVRAHPEWDGRGVLIAICDSGVDLDLPGLRTTSDGKPKILDARVFCDEGKIELAQAEAVSDSRGTAWKAKEGKWLYGVSRLSLSPPAEAEVLLGYFEEKDFLNSEGAEGGDLNQNGSAEDVFGLVAFKGVDGHWVAYLDTNGDGDLSDEMPVSDFAEKREVIRLRGRDTRESAEIMTFALNLWPGEKEAALYAADGSHGTHVAGIAAGFQIDGQAGFDGVAPGAQILALKIGDNTLTGGATTPGSMISAWRYAVKKAGELGMPLVIQMSYGIGSEHEGRSAAERLIDELLDENPGVVATVSAGNEGPGLSTVGLPSCSRHALAVAAVLNRTSAKDLYGADLTQDEMFSFSSRGGEVAKPDVAAPGFAASTVPVYEKGRNVFRGTSMAAPQAAGGCALLLCAARASGLKVRRDHVVAAVKRGAAPIPGYGPLDQGPGLMHVGRSWEVLQALVRRDPARPVLYRFETESAESPDGKGNAVFWRGDFYPSEGRPQTVTVRPEFPKEASADQRAAFYEAFDLACPADWVRVGKGSAFAKAEEPATVPLAFDAARLKKPGLYQTRVLGYAKGLSAGERERLGPEWALPVAVVVPDSLGPAGGFSVQRRVEGLAPAKVERVFVRSEPQVGALVFEVKLAEGQANRTIQCTLFDPEGREASFSVLRPDRQRATFSLGPEELSPGVWELDLYAGYLNPGPVSATVSIQAFASAVPVSRGVPARLSQGKAPSAELALTSSLPFALRGTGTGEVIGAVTDKDVKVSGASWKRSFTLAPGESGVAFGLEMSPEDFGLFTDIAARVLDSEGKALESDGMSFRRLSLEFEPPAGSKPGAAYTLAVDAATADPDEGSPKWTLKVRELHRYAEPVPLVVKQGKQERVVLYPDHEATLTLQLKGVPPALPEKAAWLAEVTLKDAERENLRIPLEVKLEARE